MSPKVKTVYRCTECGADHPKWAGKCDVCGEWNTLVEEMAAPKVRAAAGGSARRVGGLESLGAGGSVATTTRLRNVAGSEAERVKTGLGEFDFVLGGGIVPGSMVLVGGEPGIGKSTMLLQVAARVNDRGGSALYVTGEESPLQVKLRADRLDDGAGDVELLSETLLETILATARRSRASRDDRRFDSDGVHGGPRGRARQRRPGAGMRRAAHAIREGVGHGGVRRRARHQGRRHRRPEDARAHRRHRAVLRGRQRARPSRAARDEESLRQRGRDRRLSDERERTIAGRQSVGAVPRATA